MAEQPSWHSRPPVGQLSQSNTGAYVITHSY
jgi:hypothetical protein